MPVRRAGVLGSSVGALTLGFLLLRGPLSGPAPSAPQPQNQGGHRAARVHHVPGSAVAPSQELPEDGPWQASRQHFAGVQATALATPAPRPPPTPVPVVAPGQPTGRAAAIGSEGAPAKSPEPGECGSIQDRTIRWCIPSHEEIQVVIATAPDPFNTHMSLQFDRSVEAIQLAAESMNYVADRYWLPWDPSAKLDWRDYDSQQQAEKDQDQKEQEPGLLLFRWNGDVDTKTPSTLYVFVVSETPTAGVDGEQFRRAIAYRAEICRQGHCFVRPNDPDSNRIRILGPTFSGSLASVVRLTRSSFFKAYSGTVSSICAMESQHLVKSTELCTATGQEVDANLRFKSYVGDTESAIESFLESLVYHGDINCDSREAPQVALLSETATAYGATGSFLQKRAKKDFSASCATSFSYPREISSLRNAYQASVSSSVVVQDNNVKNPQLTFTLSDREPNKNDEPPDFSGTQGPLSKEAVLMKLATELQRNNYKYIGVSGTNVLDVLFLVSFVRSSCPDARPFIVNSDLLFDRNLDNAPYIGTLSLTSYPLVARNLDWTTQFANKPRLPFADQYEEGEYNAFVSTLQEVLPQQNPGAFYEMNPPVNSGAKGPSLWLTAVGTGGYWPVRVLSSSGDPFTIAPALKRDDFAPAWGILLTVLCLLAVYHIYTLLTVSPLSPRFRDFALTTAMPTQRLFFINVASAALAIALLSMVLPVYTFGWRGGPYVIVVSLSAALLILGLMAICAWLQVGYRRRLKWMEEIQRSAAHNQQDEDIPDAHPYCNCESSQTVREWGPLVLAAAVWVCFILLGVLWLHLFLDANDYYGFFFAFRSLYLATVVSPFTPMLTLLAVMYCWSIVEVWRIRFNNRQRPRLELGQTGFPGGFSEQPIASAVSRFFLGRPYVVAFFVIFAFWLALFDPLHPFQSFEDRAFSFVYTALFAVAMAMMLSCGLRLWEVWSMLRGLLQELERTPLRLAFGRLRGFRWYSIWRQGGDEDQWINMSRSLEAIRQIKKCDSIAQESRTDSPSGATADSGGLNGDVEKLEEAAKEIRLCLPEIRRRKITWVFSHCLREYQDASRCPGDAEADDVKKRPLVDLLYEIEQQFLRVQHGFANVLKTVMQELQKKWSERCLVLVEHEELQSDDHPTAAPEELSDEKHLQQLEEYAALRYLAFIRGVLWHIRHLLFFLVFSFTLVLISLNVYSFEPHKTLVWSFTATFCVVGFVIVLVLAQLHRDQILSRATGTKPNELGGEFYVRVIALGAIPLLTLVATHFPSIGHYLLSYLQPGLQALK